MSLHGRFWMTTEASAGNYPSHKRVLSIISKRSSSLTSVHFTSRALKQIRGKLAEAAQAVAVRRTRVWNHIMVAIDWNDKLAVMANLSFQFQRPGKLDWINFKRRQAPGLSVIEAAVI